MATAESLSKTVRIKGKRYYDVGKERYLPSVTTILGQMTDKSFLLEWRKRIGDAEADRISKFSANRGSVMHQMIEYFLLSERERRSKRLEEAQEKIAKFSEEKGYTDEEIAEGMKLFYKFYNTRTFDKIDSIVSIEQTLYCLKGGGYAGRCDTIYRRTDGGIIISDYKTSKKAKKREWIENYFLQAAAYFIAYWEMTDVKPAACEIWIANPFDDEPQIFEMDLAEIQIYAKKFLKLVKQFHEQNS